MIDGLRLTAGNGEFHTVDIQSVQDDDGFFLEGTATLGGPGIPSGRGL